MPMSESNRLKKDLNIILVLSNLWQARIYQKIIATAGRSKVNLLVVCLRERLISDPVWKDFKVNSISFIDISSQFSIDRLGFLWSLKNFCQIKLAIRDDINKFFLRNHYHHTIVLVDDLYRIHELCTISCISQDFQVLCLPHGLRRKNNIFTIARTKFSEFMRVILFCNLGKLFALKKNFLLKSNTTHGTIYANEASYSKRRMHVGNLAIQSSITDLEHSKDVSNISGILFLGSGAFRYNNKEDQRLNILAMKFAIDFAKKSGQKISFKFKPGEKIDFLHANFPEYSECVIDDQCDLLSTIELSQPGLVFCSKSSTVVAELILSGYKVFLYESIFTGYNDAYYEIYQKCGLHVQDLNFSQINLAKNINIGLLKRLIGVQKRPFSFFVDFLRKLD